MIFFDVTKSASARHWSGLTRVNSRLRAELGSAAVSVSWSGWDRGAGKSDWFFTAELFSEAERPGFGDFVRGKSCRTAAVFYDAIPLKFPHITWPRSVARHPAYLKLLADFDRVWAISAASREELLGYWRWLGVAAPPPVDVLPLGADFAGPAVAPRTWAGAGGAGKVCVPPSLLCLGIVEPRKNQSFLLDVCVGLWAEGLAFDLHLAGRVNPHFGKPLLKKIRALGRRFPGLAWHERLGDADLARLWSGARATVFPTIAEGSGLPLLESLGKGIPCVASDLPALRENAAGGGCLLVPASEETAWKTALRSILTDDALHRRLAAEAAARILPTWAQTAATLRKEMGI